jgi:hypothetical protein
VGGRSTTKPLQSSAWSSHFSIELTLDQLGGVEGSVPSYPPYNLIFMASL